MYLSVTFWHSTEDTVNRGCAYCCADCSEMFALSHYMIWNVARADCNRSHSAGPSSLRRQSTQTEERAPPTTCHKNRKTWLLMLSHSQYEGWQYRCSHYRNPSFLDTLFVAVYSCHTASQGKIQILFFSQLSKCTKDNVATSWMRDNRMLLQCSQWKDTLVEAA